VRPLGDTLATTRLNRILKPYLTRLEDSIERRAYGEDISAKPFNIITITDGVPSDGVKSVIMKTARKLD
jgi:hypothetical protein